LESGSNLLEHLLGSGGKPSDIQGLSKTYPEAGEGLRRCLTSKVRPISRSANTLNISTAASGFVPASEHDGGSFDLRLGGGEREGSDYILPSFSEVFFAITRDICVIFFLMGSFVTTCTSIAYS
jgi:hypothetical protein